MKHRILFILIITLLLALNHHNLEAQKMKNKGILLVSFGSSYPEAQAAFHNIEEETLKSFPDTKIYWAYTSKFIRRKLAKTGKHIDSPAQALAKMTEDGITHIAVQSLHVIPGSEYHDLQTTVDAFVVIPKGPHKIILGDPLLYNNQDNKELAEALKDIFSSQLHKHEALLFMGHGTSHFSNIYYPGFEYYLQNQMPQAYMGTVEGYPELSDVIESLRKEKIKNVILAPFMTVCGDHVQNDMVGNEKESWKSILEAEGFTVTPSLKGLAEYDSIVAIYIKHLKKSWDELDH